MADSDEANWLDEAFDEEKAAEDLERAQRSRRIGLFFAAVLLAVITLLMFSCAGILDAMNMMQ